MQFYLPDGGTLEHLGTSLYTKRPLAYARIILFPHNRERFVAGSR